MPETSKGDSPGPQAQAGAAGDGAGVIFGLLRGWWRLAALHTMVELGCADHLAEGPLTVPELASRCGAHAPSLARVLRTVASTGLIKTAETGTYALTEAGAVLRGKSAPRLAVQFSTSPDFWAALGDLTRTVRTGRSSFTERNGPIYDYLAGNRELGRLFDDFMVARQGPLAQRVPELLDFSGAQRVVDVGGGNGTFLAPILRSNPHLRGVLLERERALPAAREFLTAQGVSGRCELVAGDFFESVPAGGDVYLLANIVHNWDDDSAARVLRAVRRAVTEGQVLLLDSLLPDDDEPHYGKDLDIRMLGIFEGKERSESEYFSLLENAGLRADRTTDLPFGLSLIEASPV